VAGEGIGCDEFAVDDQLEGVWCVQLFLKMSQRGAEAIIGLLHFDKEPGLLVANDHEIDFALLFVAEVAKFEACPSSDNDPRSAWTWSFFQPVLGRLNKEHLAVFFEMLRNDLIVEPWERL
jgi:hypothetical protein